MLTVCFIFKAFTIYLARQETGSLNVILQARKMLPFAQQIFRARLIP